MSVKIVIDSTTDLLPELLRKFEIVPLTVNFGEEEFIDGVEIGGVASYLGATDQSGLNLFI